MHPYLLIRSTGLNGAVPASDVEKVVGSWQKLVVHTRCLGNLAVSMSNMDSVLYMLEESIRREVPVDFEGRLILLDNEWAEPTTKNRFKATMGEKSSDHDADSVLRILRKGAEERRKLQ